jgi:transposase
MNKIITLPAIEGAESIPAVVGMDLAKNVFAPHAVNRHGKPVPVKPQVRRDQLLELLARLPPCIVGMKACSGAHLWARGPFN